MRKISEYKDLIQRRASEELESDSVYKVYLHYPDSPRCIRIILSNNPTARSLAEIESRYVRLFDDCLDDVLVYVLPYTNNFQRQMNDLLIYDKENKFI